MLGIKDPIDLGVNGRGGQALVAFGHGSLHDHQHSCKARGKMSFIQSAYLFVYSHSQSISKIKIKLKIKTDKEQQI